MPIANQYKVFRGVTDLHHLPFMQKNYLEKRWDEPTYMTFKVVFGEDSLNLSGTTLENTDYDRMPHPLFISQQVDAATTSNGGRNEVQFNRSIYSAIDYLRDCNEFTRAEMLKEFIKIWSDLQSNYQWYFQSIDGISDLLKVTPERGKRVGQDVRLTFNMLEGIDQRVSYLLNLYRKIAWDDTYQRWVLPDMMRYFDMKIYITEFRTFHKPIVNEYSDEPVYLQLLQKIDTVFSGVLPTYMIQCHMCEFDINSFDFSYKNKLSVNENPQAESVSFKVKIGDVNEITTYPLFQHFIFNDYKINGLQRAVEKGLMKDKNGRIINDADPNTGEPVESNYVSTKSGDARYEFQDIEAQQSFDQKDHVSGTPYNELTNKQVLFGEKGKNGVYISQSRNGQEYTEVEPTTPSTWAGNALKFGKAFTTNFVKQKVDQAKMMKVPGLGVSFNEAVAAIQSKDFLQVFGLIRRAIAQATEPGQSATSRAIVDGVFKEFLTGVSQSEATDNDQLEFIKSAKQILSNRGQWETVVDLSYATNLRGPNEPNKPVEIQNPNSYATQARLSTGGDRSKATDLDDSPVEVKSGMVIETAPSSILSRRIEGAQIQQAGQVSTATVLKIEGRGPSTTILSESTNDDSIDVNAMDRPSPSKATNNNISNA